MLKALGLNPLKGTSLSSLLVSNTNLRPYNAEMMQRSLKLLSWGEGRPVGDILTEKHRIPGYQVGLVQA